LSIINTTLSKISRRVRKDKETSKSLDKLAKQLKNREFHGGRGAEKLGGTKTVFYLRAGNSGRLFFRYLKEEKRAVEILAESTKDKGDEVIANLKKNYE
jgi:Txe/YoeB family toxin of Txe-Axe toxin-antitoxin module